MMQDDNLISCYPEVRQHLAELKSEGWIREFTTERLKDMYSNYQYYKVGGDSKDEEEK
jgi:hypothetical protein